jgi:hypothetical protein
VWRDVNWDLGVFARFYGWCALKSVSSVMLRTWVRYKNATRDTGGSSFRGALIGLNKPLSVCVSKRLSIFVVEALQLLRKQLNLIEN